MFFYHFSCLFCVVLLGLLLLFGWRCCFFLLLFRGVAFFWVFHIFRWVVLLGFLLLWVVLLFSSPLAWSCFPSAPLGVGCVPPLSSDGWCCLVSFFCWWCCCFPFSFAWCCFSSPGGAAFSPSCSVGWRCLVFSGCCCRFFCPFPLSSVGWCCLVHPSLGWCCVLLCLLLLWAVLLIQSLFRWSCLPSPPFGGTAFHHFLWV